jgi:hypothetical protein
MGKPAYLYQPQTVVRWRSEPARGAAYGGGSRFYAGQNPARGASLYYSLNKKADKISLKIVDFAGKTVRELKATATPGLHMVQWDLLRPGVPGNVVADKGMYRVVLNVDGDELTQPLRIEGDPTLPPHIVTEEETDHPLKKKDRRIED